MVAVYNKWHQTELERWLTDHDVSYPKASDRKDLESLVKSHWDDVVAQPYSRWSIAELTAYLREKGQDAQTVAEESKDSLLSQVKSNWYETEDAAVQGWANAKDWMLDTWSDSQLKAFCDKQGIPGMYEMVLLSKRSFYLTAFIKISYDHGRNIEWCYIFHPQAAIKTIADCCVLTQYHNQGNETVSCRKPVSAMKKLRKKQARQLLIPATGCISLGVTQTSRVGWTNMVFQFRSLRRATNWSPPYVAILGWAFSKLRNKLRAPAPAPRRLTPLSLMA